MSGTARRGQQLADAASNKSAYIAKLEAENAALKVQLTKPRKRNSRKKK